MNIKTVSFGNTSKVFRLGYSSRRLLGQILLYTILLFLSIIFAFPLFYTISSSLKEISEMFAFPPKLLPDRPQFVNYVRLFEVVPFGQWMMNTIRIVILATTGTVLSATVVAYSLARFQYRGRDLLFLITLSTMMLPAQVTLIPQFVLFHRLGWINTIRPLWVPAWFGGGAFGIFLMRQFILSLPRELDEAALIDGAGSFRILWQIIVPLSKPVLATLLVISFMSNWSSFIEPLIYLNSPGKFTLAIGLNYLRAVPETAQDRLDHLLMAACVLNILPMMIVFFAAQRYFVHGIVMSGIKG